MTNELGIFINDNRVVVSSRDIARVFEKAHKYVIEVIRTLECSVDFSMKDGEPWWVTKDVCDVLEIGNSRQAISYLDNDEKGVITNDTIGREQAMAIISEAGLYSLILRSRKPEAKAFKRWITHEVLPSIRKTGSYSTTPALPKDYISALEALLVAEKAKIALADENAKQKQVINELKPKADYTDSILRNRGLVAITQIAKDYGMSGNAMNAKLHELGVQYKLGNQWLLYAKHQKSGYTHSETYEFEHKDRQKSDCGKLLVLKNRPVGITGEAGFVQYSHETGRLLPVSMGTVYFPPANDLEQAERDF